MPVSDYSADDIARIIIGQLGDSQQYVADAIRKERFDGAKIAAFEDSPACVAAIGAAAGAPLAGVALARLTVLVRNLRENTGEAVFEADAAHVELLPSPTGKALSSDWVVLEEVPEHPPSPLAALGYAYVPGPSGEPSDLVLRQTADPSRGFAWKGQEDYDRVGAAVLACPRTSRRAWRRAGAPRSWRCTSS